MAKILFIIPYIPYPLNSGGNQAFYNMVDYLRQKMEVSLLLHVSSGKQMQDVEALQERWRNVTFYLYRQSEHVPQVKHPRYYHWLQKVQASVGRKMRRQIIYRPEEAPKDLVRERTTLYCSTFSRLEGDYVDYVYQVARKGFDFIQVEFYELISLGYLLPPDVQTLFVHHELRYIRNGNELSLLKGPVAEDHMVFNIAKDFERSALKRYKHVIALTEIDRKLLQDLLGSGTQVYASPAVVHIPECSPGSFTGASTHRLTFVGTEGHFPNMDAVNWFCREVAPELRSRNFSFTFEVAGDWYSSAVKSLQKVCPEMKVMGYVPDLSAFLKGSIALVPVRIGSGMRMKILDAVFSHVPFVTTYKGVEGIDFRNGEECLMADTASGFADSIVRLAGDPGLQSRLVAQSEQRLRSLYNPQEMLERRWNIYQKILQDKE